MFGMSTFRKGREVGVADVFHVLVYARRGSIVAVDRHLFQQYEEPFQIGLGVLFSKSDGWAAPIFFGPRPLRRTWGTRPVSFGSC